MRLKFWKPKQQPEQQPVAKIRDAPYEYTFVDDRGALVVRRVSKSYVPPVMSLNVAIPPKPDHHTWAMHKMIHILCTERHCGESELLEDLVIAEFQRRKAEHIPLEAR